MPPSLDLDLVFVGSVIPNAFSLCRGVRICRFLKFPNGLWLTLAASSASVSSKLLKEKKIKLMSIVSRLV